MIPAPPGWQSHQSFEFSNLLFWPPCGEEPVGGVERYPFGLAIKFECGIIFPRDGIAVEAIRYTMVFA